MICPITLTHAVTTFWRSDYEVDGWEYIGCGNLKHKFRRKWLHVSKAARKISVNCALEILFILDNVCQSNYIFRAGSFPSLGNGLVASKAMLKIGYRRIYHVRQDKKYQKPWLCNGFVQQIFTLLGLYSHNYWKKYILQLLQKTGGYPTHDVQSHSYSFKSRRGSPVGSRHNPANFTTDTNKQPLGYDEHMVSKQNPAI